MPTAIALTERATATRATVVCRVNVVETGPDGAAHTHRYHGLFVSPAAAFDDAMDRFPCAHYIGVLIGAGA